MTSELERPEDLVERLLGVVGEDGKEEIVTLGEQLIERGRQDGLREGRQEESRASLLKLLRSRSGDVPDAIAARIQTATAAEAERWFDRGLTAHALDEVFVDD